jgi:hypothetical protein
MSERAALYTVAVRPRRGAELPLGDIDGAGTAVQDVLVRILDGFAETSADGARVVVAAVAARDGDDLLAILQHGVRGVAADIVDQSGGVRFRQTPDDLQLLRSGCLFRLPPTSTSGTLAVHVSNGRGVKELFEQGLAARFGSLYPDLRLAIERLAEPGALRDAVAQNRIEKVSLLLHDSAGTVPDTGKWAAAGRPARLELEVAASPIQSRLLDRYLAGEPAALGEIVRFAGITFDRVRVGVRLADDTRRVYDLEHPEAGRPVTRELAGIELDAAGEPTDASLLVALRAVLDA